MYIVNVGFILLFGVSTTTINPAASLTPPLLLSPLLNKNRIQDARNASIVDPSYFLNVNSHSGFLTVDERYNSNLFFWYFPVANKPVNETPLIIWLQGGPGASSLVGLFDEIGPFQYDDANLKLKLREWPWSKEYSLLFIDNPVGAGYSFTNNTRSGLAHDMDQCADHFYSALQQFLKMFPELRKAPLYIAGESYAGHYVPAFAMKILNADNKQSDLSINLQGLIMGNPVLNRENIANYTSIFYMWGLIDSQGVLAAKSLQDAYIDALQRENDQESFNLREQLLNKLQDLAFQPQLYNVLKDAINFKGFQEYINNNAVREAMHVGESRFEFSNPYVHEALVSDFLSKVRPKVEKLLEHYRILIYCGQLDLTAPCVPNAEARRTSWHWSGRERFMSAHRLPWWFNETVAGYVKTGGGFTEVLVRGAGHIVPMDKPAEVQQLVSYFIRGLDMPLPTNYEVDANDTPQYVVPNNENITRTYPKTALIISIVINFVLLLSIVLGIVYFLRWKRRNENYFYSTAEDSISDGILTMS